MSLNKYYIPSIFLLLLLSITNLYSQNKKNILNIDLLEKPIGLDNYTYIYSTKDSSTNINNILDKEFINTPKGLHGINDNTIYWERYSFSNTTNREKEYYIYFPYAIINKLIVFTHYKNIIIKNASLGMLYPRKNKEIESIGYPIKISLKPGITDVYIYIKHFRLALRTTSFLLTEAQLRKSNENQNEIIWFWKGFYIFAALIAIILFIVTRRKMFLYYFMLNLGMGTYFTGEIGEISKVITNVPFNLTANIKQTGILLAFISLPLLINQITPYSKLRPKLWKLILFINGFIALNWFICLFPYTLTTNVFLFTTYLYNFYAPLILISQLYLLYVAYKAHINNSKVLFIGYGGYIFALFIYGILPNLGLLQQNLMVYNTFILGSLFEIFIFMLILGKETFSVYQHRATLLEKQKEHQSNIICAIVESQEKERNKVGRELHDMIGANISVIKQQADKSNEKLLNIIDRTIESVRHLSHGLVTPLIKDDDFVDEINELCVLFSNIDLKVKTHFHNWNRIDNKIIVTHLYRITQELLQNAVKHSKASKISIQFLVNNNGELTLMYEDNGIGFDYDKAIKGDGLGLININNRIHIIKSKIYYDTEKNRNGTTVVINVPASTICLNNN
ncbi:MAG: hypothetical protein DRI86_05955 [Bacteroidetes bacterium]|nr:MAG: hypothetical protein DRI86_05955 [Bacteroidota bacterium]